VLAVCATAARADLQPPPGSTDQYRLVHMVGSAQVVSDPLVQFGKLQGQGFTASVLVDITAISNPTPSLQTANPTTVCVDGNPLSSTFGNPLPGMSLCDCSVLR
jgi:hypothetical protein